MVQVFFNEKKMPTKFENLPFELLLKICNYLSTEQCFQAFSNLNSHFNSALNLAIYSIDLTSIHYRTYEQIYDRQIFPHHAKQIRKLKLNNNLTFGLLERFFNDYYLEDFHQLRSLTLINPTYMTLGAFAWILPKLEQLEHLAIESCSAYPSNFFHSIGSSSSLKFCFLPQLELDDEITFQSNIEMLSITVDNIGILLNLLSMFTNLKYLHVILKSSLYDDLPEIEQHVSCEHLENFKVNILEKSSIQFDEIEYFFQQITFSKLKSLSYNSITHSLDHLNISKWNEILQQNLFTIKQLNFFIQIPIQSYSTTEIQSHLKELQTNFALSSTFSYAINSTHYLIYTNNYPKRHYHLSDVNDDIDLNTSEFSTINSLTLDTRICTCLPSNIKHLQIQIDPSNLSYLLQDCSKRLLSLKLIGLPDHLPILPNLKEITIQRLMFNLSMTKILLTCCPRLQLLTFEIDCLNQFDAILEQLRKLNQLKFIRIFSRDTNQTWNNWINERNELLKNIKHEIRNVFLFLWL